MGPGPGGPASPLQVPGWAHGHVLADGIVARFVHMHGPMVNLRGPWFDPLRPALEAAGGRAQGCAACGGAMPGKYNAPGRKHACDLVTGHSTPVTGHDHEVYQIVHMGQGMAIKFCHRGVPVHPGRHERCSGPGHGLPVPIQTLDHKVTPSESRQQGQVITAKHHGQSASEVRGLDQGLCRLGSCQPNRSENEGHSGHKPLQQASCLVVRRTSHSSTHHCPPSKSSRSIMSPDATILREGTSWMVLIVAASTEPPASRLPVRPGP